MKNGHIAKKISSVALIVVVFWLIDFILHASGVGESNYYYLSKFANSILFATLWFFVFQSRKEWKKLLYSFIFGTWVSFYYLISSYSGLVQWLGIEARYTPPPFVIFGIFLTPFLWWILHSVAFYAGLKLAESINKESI